MTLNREFSAVEQAWGDDEFHLMLARRRERNACY